MTTSRTITIGELAIRVRSADLSSTELDTAIASDFEVEVEFSYEAGHPGKRDGPWEDAIEPVPAAACISSIKSSANVHFEGEVTSVIVRRGTDFLLMFSNREVTAMEDLLMVMMGAGQ